MGSNGKNTKCMYERMDYNKKAKNILYHCKHILLVDVRNIEQASRNE